MCDFPSWIEQDDGTALFLTDAEVEERGLALPDAVGHAALRKVYPQAGGTDREGFPCHPQVAKAIRDGKMTKLMEGGGYKAVRVNAEGQCHRDDGPAIEYASGTKYWYRNGQCHRDDGPAVEWADGTKYWYRNGQRHRDDGPAVEWADGTKWWYREGQRIPSPATSERISQ